AIKVAAYLPTKVARNKRAEITKRVVSDQFAAKAIPIVNGREADFPNDTLDQLGEAVSLTGALASASRLGMVLRPREFQRVVLIRMGLRDDADRYQRLGLTFRRPDEAAAVEEMPRHPGLPAILRMLLPFLSERSAAGPELEQRIVMAPIRADNPAVTVGDVPVELSIKLSGAYQAYRRSIEPTFRDAAQDTADGSWQKVAQRLHRDGELPLVTREYFARSFLEECSHRLS
ncbi:MAG: hypothetical protein WCP53_09300, partial [Verrucomicrobiota bacterium]